MIIISKIKYYNENTREDLGGGGGTPPPTPPPTTDGGNDNSSSESSSDSKDPDKTADGNKGGGDGNNGYTNPEDIAEDFYNPDIESILNYTENPKISYAGSQVQNPTPETGTKAREFLHSFTQTRVTENLPPGYYDTMIYDHRKAILDMVNLEADANVSDEIGEDGVRMCNDETFNRVFVLGDCFFIIPPEFISVTRNSSHDSIQSIRSSSSSHIKHGYATKDIQINLVLNGMDQINGYKVPSPFSKNYYVDGLRSLISQFKYTPFVPVQNTLMNLTNGIFNVAMRNLLVETVPGFPECINVVIAAQNFNTETYLPFPEDAVVDCIDWDLYRWYTQRSLCDKATNSETSLKLKKIENKDRGLTNSFKIKLLSQTALDKSNEEASKIPDKGEASNEERMFIDLTDESNFGTLIDSDINKNVSLTYMSFSMGNILPVIQLSDAESPTMQYLGASDTTFNFTFEVNGQDGVTLFDQVLSENIRMVRDNRFTNGMGFIKIENELVQLAGVEFLLITNLNTTTTPGFPDVFTVNLSCVSYDINREQKEKLKGFKPFPGDRDGTKEDVWDNEKRGLGLKIKQESMALCKLQEAELYPDMQLPTYSQVDDIYSKIRVFREKNNLSPLHVDKYPRHLTLTPNSPQEVEYEGFVDPDFYYYYAASIADYSQSSEIPDELKGINNVISRSFVRNGKITPEEALRITSSIDVSKIKNPLDMFGVFRQAIPDVAKEPKYVYGWEPGMQPKMHRGKLNPKEESGNGSAGAEGQPSEGDGDGDVSGVGGGGGSGASGDPTTIKKVTGNPFVDYCIDRAESGCGYLWASHGQIMTQELYNQTSKNHPGDIRTDSLKWMGKQVFDCSGFVSWGLTKVGYWEKGRRTTTHGFIAMKRISKSELRAGDILVTSSHAALYIGDGKTVEAKNSKLGVVFDELGNRFTHFIRPDGLEKQIQKFLSDNPDVYETSSSTGNGQHSNQNIQGTTRIENNSSRRAMTRRPDIGTGAGSGSATEDSMQETNRDKRRVALADFTGEYEACNKFNPMILAGARTYNLDPNFIKCIIAIESGGNPNVINSLGCYGLMQIRASAHPSFKGNKLDPENNIKFGCGIWDNYRKISYVGTDIDTWFCAYNAGPGNCQAYVKRGRTGLFKETVNYIEKYKKLYVKLVANGGSAGGTYTPGGTNAVGDAIWPEGMNMGTININEMNNMSGASTSSPGWSMSEQDFMNLTAGELHGEKPATVDPMTFGRPQIEKIGEDAPATITHGAYIDIDIEDIADKTKFINKTDKIVEYMFVDSRQYSAKGTMCRAFPTYMLVFIDEMTDWCDTKKLWDNYYICNSLIECDVFEDESNPASTCRLTLSNFQGNLTKVRRPILTEDLFGDGIYEGAREWFYRTTGAIPDEKITDEMIAIKNKIYEDLRIDEGARIHLRLGYGSDPSRIPTVFNGIVTEIQDGEIINIVAQGDGREFALTEVTDKTSATQEDLNLGEETSNIIVELLLRRENDFLSGLSFGNWFYRHAYGINHFGFHTDFIADFNHRHYDMVKNIYNGTYTGKPFCSGPFNPFDGESNYRFIASGKTSWDILKMCEKAIPEFIAYYRPFGFEHRVYYGLPQWLCKYTYIYANAKDTPFGQFGELYEAGKSFAQVHEISGVDSIIENTLRASSKGHFTNAIGIYSLGGDLTSTPMIFSDREISPTKQATKILDTSTIQDFGFVPSIVDKLISWIGAFDNGKNLAIKVSISELLNSWKNTYKGAVLCLGQPEIRPYDYIYLDDTFLNITGVVTARQVYHSLSVNTGFTTSVTPGLIGVNTMKTSGFTNVLRSVICAAGSIWAGKRLSKMVLRNYAKYKGVVSGYRLFGYLRGTKAGQAVTAAGGAKNFIVGAGKSIWASVKSAKIVTQFTGWVKNVNSLKKVYGAITKSKIFVKGISAVKTVISGGKAAAGAATAATGGGFLPFLIITLVIDAVLNIFLGWLIDMFQYDNCVTLFPLTRALPNGEVTWFLTSYRGGKKIVPFDQEVLNDAGIELEERN